ncbi:hypothetical protein JSO19_11000 [Leucobacter sp. UCMA 4100]|uniref:hypothetical protein n=1 Tax=Leucobacter sp. UCMA 4100 TaxID=2810534 RepID=UPI0022EA57DF|nr:hypothetical protein [Leucobacter sp. UCMA 4100]MDA3147903.1 hypothetical protein [Leucobacter sp. UCMA 4100]
MTTRQQPRTTQRVTVAGTHYLVVLDEAGDCPITASERVALLRRESGTAPAGIVRAVRSEHLEEGRSALAEDPAAAWWCETVSASGSSLATSGGGVLAAVAALGEWGSLRFEDRRDAIPMATPDGIRDVLAGRSGYAVDLGRWRFAGRPETDSLHTVRIGSEHIEVVAHLSDATPERGLRTAVLAADEALGSPRITHGVGQARVSALLEGEMLPSSCLVAAATALTLRHRGGLETPHHWAVEFDEATIGVRMFATEEGEHVSVNAPVHVLGEPEGH